MSAHFTDEFLIHYGVPGMKKGQKMSPEEKAARERLRYERQVAAANRRAAAQQRKLITPRFALRREPLRNSEKPLMLLFGPRRKLRERVRKRRQLRLRRNSKLSARPRRLYFVRIA